MSQDQDYERQMEMVARTLDELFNGKFGGPERATGFVLLVYPAGDPEGCNYLSGGTNRTEAIVAMRATIEQLEDGVEI